MQLKKRLLQSETCDLLEEHVVCLCAAGYSVTVGDFNDDGKEGEMNPSLSLYQHCYSEYTVRLIIRCKSDQAATFSFDHLLLVLVIFQGKAPQRINVVVK